MKAILNDDVLSLIYGGTDGYQLPEWDDLSLQNELLGHGKTQPGNNDEIFNRNRH